jgi:predicted thioesterase
MATHLDPESAEALLGATGQVRHHVTAADTAAAQASGDLPVLGTPRMIALMEQAACRALLGRIPPQLTSVGTHVDVKHVKAAMTGTDVVAYAEVVEVNGSRLTYALRAELRRGDDAVEIGSGTHVRAIVDREEFVNAL